MNPELNQEIAVVAVITANEGQHDRVLAALQTAIIAVRLEPGCEQYVLHQDLQSPNRLIMIERWRSAADLDAHANGAALQALAGELKGRAKLEVSRLIPLSGN